jgi:single-strand DNA-binding protein
LSHGKGFAENFLSPNHSSRRTIMPSLNRVQLIGRLGKDPETRLLASGKKVCSFSIAVSQRWRSGDGDKKENTDWFNVEAWGKTGEICQQYLNKGRLIYLEGRLHTDRVEKDGDVRFYTKVTVNMVEILDKKEGEAEVEGASEE